MRSFAVINQKGGVGKTTTAVNVAAALARRGRRVLLVDLDPQAHATLHLGLTLGPEDTSTYDVLVRSAPAEQVMRTVEGRLSILPAHIDLVGAEVELVEQQDRELVVSRALAGLGGQFDFCLLDCPPSLGLLTINALAAVDEVLIPLQPHFLALQGLGRLLETVSLVRGVLRPGLRVTGIVLCMYDRGTRLAQEVFQDVSRFVAEAEYQDAWYGARVFETCIRRNIKLAECPSFGQTIFAYAPASHGAEDYLALAGEILDGGTSAASPAENAAESAPLAEREPDQVPAAVGPEETAAERENAIS